MSGDPDRDDLDREDAWLDAQRAHEQTCDRLDYERRERATTAPRHRPVATATHGGHRARHHAP